MMTLRKTRRILAGISLGMFLLASCTSPTVVVPPTQDIPLVRTEAAATVVARLTIAAALNPTATEAPTQAPPEPIVITATQADTPTASAAAATQAPTATAAAPTATAAPTQRPAAGGGIYPTRTVRSIPDNLTYLSSTPPDLARFTPGASFDGTWTVKNTGTTTWTTDYYLRFARGTDMGEATHFYLKEPVKPGETATLVADLVAPPNAGTHVAYYEFCTDNADIIYTFYVAIVVP